MHEGFYDLYFSPNTLLVIKQKAKYAGHIAYMEEIKSKMFCYARYKRQCLLPCSPFEANKINHCVLEALRIIILQINSVHGFTG